MWLLVAGLATAQAETTLSPTPTEEPTPQPSDPAPGVTVTPADTTSWRDMLIGFILGAVSGLAALTGGALYLIKVVLSSPILRDVVEKLAASIPPEVAQKLLQIASDLKGIGEGVTEILQEDAPPVPIGQTTAYKQE